MKLLLLNLSVQGSSFPFCLLLDNSQLSLLHLPFPQREGEEGVTIQGAAFGQHVLPKWSHGPPPSLTPYAPLRLGHCHFILTFQTHGWLGNTEEQIRGCITGSRCSACQLGLRGNWAAIIRVTKEGGFAQIESSDGGGVGNSPAGSWVKSKANPEITLNAVYSQTQWRVLIHPHNAKIPTVVTSNVVLPKLLFFFKSFLDYRNRSNTSLRN